MSLTFMRETLRHRQVQLLSNAGLQNFASRIDYLHIQTRAAPKISYTRDQIKEHVNNNRLPRFVDVVKYLNHNRHHLNEQTHVNIHILRQQNQNPSS